MRVRALLAAALAATALTAGGVAGTANAASGAASDAVSGAAADATAPAAPATASAKAVTSGPVKAAASFTVWATDVNMRDNPGDPARCDSHPSVANCPVVAGQLQPGDRFEAACQKQGEPVGGNPWWVYASIGDSRGFVASHYVDVAEDQLPGVPVCGA
ncbi:MULTISPECIES: hypothetical protein [Streptomyces]|uniref:SH3 domain-containing protein n=1 Tax=Streptomyces lycii TaxID=2654337 RepID=A0ABQ7F8C9_9ACTN|nr:MULTISPECIES: hypothetical protein [Streptomyces]KAF4405121.1 hypothetical protein GCU69_32290 [Streptomyces lycii]PGH48947.1 hypothetical protein CRI70_20355 [Streptomyces sp. Ru87]